MPTSLPPHHDRHAPGVDPAQQSLADALQVSFKILSVLMLIIIVVYLGSGWFKVDAQSRAVKLRFGQIVGEPGRQVYSEGWHFALPTPIEQHLIIPIAPQTLTINKAFWYEVAPANVGKTSSELANQARPLNPEKDGSLITGDANIVHGRYEVTYAIREQDVVDYLENVGQNPDLARDVVRNAAQSGIVHAVAQTAADEFIGGRANQIKAQLFAQKILDQLHTGIKILTFSATHTQIPLPVFKAYLAVSNAESEKAQLIEAARQQYARVLGETAGQAHKPLYQLVREYELARAREDDALATELQAQLTATLTDLRMPVSRGGDPVGGKVAQVINEAITFRTETVQTVRQEAENFNQLLTEYRRNPRVLPNRLWEQTRIDVFASPNIETLYVPTGQLQIVTNRDPAVTRQRETKRLQADQDAAKQRALDNK